MKYLKRLLLLILITMFCCTNIVRAEGDIDPTGNNGDPTVVEGGQTTPKGGQQNTKDEGEPAVPEGEQKAPENEGELTVPEGGQKATGTEGEPTEQNKEAEAGTLEEKPMLLKKGSALLNQTNEAQESNDSSDHYLAFASDVHGNLNTIPAAFGPQAGVFKDAEYVALLGDMVANQGDEAKASDFYDVTKPYFPKINYENSNFHILYGGRIDVNVADDLGPEAGAAVVISSTGQRYKGTDADGNPLFYVFSIASDSMCTTTALSQAGVRIFKQWLPKIPFDIPIIVISHPSMTKTSTKDNIGAEYWHEALNYAATGVEGLTYDSETEGVPIKRNVILLSGHDYIDDPNEYAFLANSMMPIQEDTKAGHAAVDKSRIYYNALTPGYLFANGNACLMKITNGKDFSLTKYKNGEPQDAWFDGTSKENLGDTINIAHIDPPPGPVITEQPVSAVVSYPQGAEFHIEVANPEGVTYQWYHFDVHETVHELEGISATTDTLRVQSTQRSTDWGFFCIVTDSAGNQTKSNQVTLKVSNPTEYKPVLYIGEFALEPGASINLANTYLDPGKTIPLGSGTIAYNANGTDITINDLYYDNSQYIAGSILRQNCGLYLNYYLEGDYPEDRLEYHVTFNGENTLNNYYFVKDYDLEGIPLDFILNGTHNTAPTVYLEGPGSLHITNGSIGLRAIGNLSIGIPVTVEQRDSVYSDGIHATENMLIQDTNINLSVYGRGIVAENGNLFTKNATVNITSYTPAVSAGDTALSLVKSRGRMLFENSTVRINSQSDPAICGSIGDLLMIAANDLYIDKSHLSIFAQAKENNKPYIEGVGGINANTMNVLSSEFSMNLNFPSALGITGVSTAKEINIENSKVNLDVSGDHSVYGVLANGEFTPPDKYTGVKIMIANSDFDLDLHNSKKIPNGDTFGVICGDLDVGIGNEKQQVRISVNDGKALSLVTSDFTDEEVQPQPGYQAKHLHLLNHTYCTVPENNQVNQTSIYVGDPKMAHHYQTAETIYDADDMSLAMEIVFKKDYAPLVERVSWNRDQDSDLKLTVIGRGNKEGAVGKFVELKVDNKTVPAKYYKVSKGSVVIDISKDYLQTLSDGVHIARAVFQDGETQFRIIISRNPAPTPSPDPDKPRYIPPVTGVE